MPFTPSIGPAQVVHRQRGHRSHDGECKTPSLLEASPREQDLGGDRARTGSTGRPGKGRGNVVPQEPVTACPCMRILATVSTRPDLRSLAVHALRFVGYGAVGAVVMLVAGALWLGVSRIPDLKPWHRAALREEFTRADTTRVRDFDAYRALEGRLFEELRHEVHDSVADGASASERRISRSSVPCRRS